MDFFALLAHTLQHCPFDPTAPPPELNTMQCRALSLFFSSKLERFFGAALWPPSDASSSNPARRWNSLSSLYDKTLSKWWSVRKEHKSGSDVLFRYDGVSLILDELRTAPQGTEVLYRVINEAQHFIHTCGSPDWWKAAITIGLTTEAFDVHIHDLVWCIAGLKLALQSVRGVDLHSRARFTRLEIAECYAELAELSAEDSELVRSQDDDRQLLLSVLTEMKQKYDGMHTVRKKVMNVEEKHKHGTACFLLQRITLPSETLGNRNESQIMRIRSRDLSFPSHPCLIGRGSFGPVYEAFWMGMKVAAKQFPYETSKNLLQHEVSLLGQLQCPFIAQLIGWCIDTEQNKFYLVMELVKNNLASLVLDRRKLNKPLRLPVLVDLMLQISRGMEYLHAMDLMHRNLKPSNVLVEPLCSCKELIEEGYGRVKLCDYGLAIDRSHAISNVDTTCYMAPEVLVPQKGFETGYGIEWLKYSFKADVYSFGMTFAYCLNGKHPFKGKTSGATLLKMVTNGDRPELPSSCPRFLNDFIQKCWSRNPSTRPSFPSITMMLRQSKLLLMKARSPERLSESLSNEEVFLSTPSISYQELSVATHGFTLRFPQITQDSIYRGVLSDGNDVLVHRRKSLFEAQKVWVETSQMFNLRHANIACLRAVCIHRSQCWFVYDYTYVHGSLDRWLENPLDEPLEPLDVGTCYRIAVGLAGGLQFLHGQDVLCAVTTGNILVDEHFEPHILLSSPVHEERIENLEFHERRLDVLYFGKLIGELLLHLSSSGLEIEDPLQLPQASVLKEVESFCLHEVDIVMDEIVEILEIEDHFDPDRDSTVLDVLQGASEGDEVYCTEAENAWEHS